MGLFGKRLGDHEVQQSADKAARTLRQLSPRCVEAALKSASSYMKVHIPVAMRYVPDYSLVDLAQPADISRIPAPLQTTVTFLNTYLVWCVGAFLNGQRIIRGREWKQFVAVIRKELETISVPAQIDPFLSHLRTSERDKVQLAGRLLKAMFFNAGLYPVVFAESAGLPPIFQVDGRVQVEMESYHIPLVEFFAGLTGVAIDRLFSPDKVASQIEILRTYESEFLPKYKLTTASLWSAVGI